MSDLREHLVANLFDGDDAGVLTAPIASHVDDIVGVVNEWLEGERVRVRRSPTGGDIPGGTDPMTAPEPRTDLDIRLDAAVRDGYISAEERTVLAARVAAPSDGLRKDVEALRTTALDQMKLAGELGPAAFFEGQVYAYDEVLRRVARVAAPSDGLLAEFDGSVCPACHCRAHDPGSCENCPRCELHTDEAAAFVLRYEPSLLAAPSDGLREALARLLDFLDDRIDQARAALATTGQPEPERPCPECGHPHGPLPEPWKTTDGHLVDPVCDWPEGDSACTCHWRGSAQPEDTRTADPGGLREAAQAVVDAWVDDESGMETFDPALIDRLAAALTPEATAPGRGEPIDAQAFHEWQATKEAERAGALTDYPIAAEMSELRRPTAPDGGATISWPGDPDHFKGEKP